MKGRKHSRELKLEVCLLFATVAIRKAHVCRERLIDTSLEARWR